MSLKMADKNHGHWLVRSYIFGNHDLIKILNNQAIENVL
jgi:hypothetical protein